MSKAKLVDPKLVPHQPIIPERHHVRGVSTLRDAAGNITAQWTKTAKDHEEREELIKRLVAELPKTIKARKGRIPPPTALMRDDMMAVYPMGDPHVGLLAWQKESGEHFDLAECRTIMTQAMRNLVQRGPRTKTALIINLGDFFHADMGTGATTKGTRVEVDPRTWMVLDVGVGIMIEMIDAALTHHEQVTVDNRIGNHDTHEAVVLAYALREHYRNEPRVHIPPPLTHRSYHLFGCNLIGTTHGDRAKPEALAEIMAAERPSWWGETTNRMWFVGHVHHHSRKDHRGCSVESFRTLAARDGWHAAEGYVAARDMVRITLHKDFGECERSTVNVAALRHA